MSDLLLFSLSDLLLLVLSDLVLFFLCRILYGSFSVSLISCCTLCQICCCSFSVSSLTALSVKYLSVSFLTDLLLFFFSVRLHLFSLCLIPYWIDVVISLCLISTSLLLLSAWSLSLLSFSHTLYLTSYLFIHYKLHFLFLSDHSTSDLYSALFSHFSLCLNRLHLTLS